MTVKDNDDANSESSESPIEKPKVKRTYVKTPAREEAVRKMIEARKQKAKQARLSKEMNKLEEKESKIKERKNKIKKVVEVVEVEPEPEPEPEPESESSVDEEVQNYIQYLKQQAQHARGASNFSQGEKPKPEKKKVPPRKRAPPKRTSQREEYYYEPPPQFIFI